MSEETDSGTAAPDERWGQCSSRACPLLGTVGRGGQWWCFCHFEADAGEADTVTRIVRSHRAIYTATLDVRAHVGADDWPRVYRSVQQRLLDAGHADLLPCELDASPYRPGRPIVQQWLARLERFLLDAVRDGLRRIAAQAATESGAGPRTPPPSSRDCVARMRATLAPLAKREASAQWAFDLLERIAAKPTNAPPPEAVRCALDAVGSPAGRAYAASATDTQRARWRAALQVIGSSAAAAMPSREPGEDDEEPERVTG
ncbi:hypothetical protein [Paraburkholderia caribensis]|uniref:hypothetical protein n=1 Tax=Paraburkholderia caribensis TaxID=75105 RepID=UPI00285DF7E0|nr:hypothetical protein [Paraburkholderia caribensis]MDR6384954.1 hypothetical protein [Paraburkholderia caribensis]